MNREMTRGLAAWALLLLTSCVTYEPAPIDPLDVLQRLDEVDLGVGPADPDSSVYGPRELAAFAITHQPQLAAIRAEVGVRRALLVEAGLLPDPQIGWDAMDLLASEIVDGTSDSVDVLSGFGVMFPLLRPGERSAREGIADSQLDQALWQVATAEWALTRDVHVAFEEVRAAEELERQTQTLTELAESNATYFEQAQAAGAATAIQASLARGELQRMRLESTRVFTRVQQSRRSLNALLGLPPDIRLALGEIEDPSSHEALKSDRQALTRHAVESRPDLTALQARYRAAEEGLRLAVAQQWPQISLGTGLQLTLPLLSDFGRPAIVTARARRARVALELTAALHEVRREIAQTHVEWELAHREVAVIENELLPNVETSLELSREAFRAGEATLLETLALQRALVEARTLRIEARARRAKTGWTLLAESGWLLRSDPDDLKEDER